MNSETEERMLTAILQIWGRGVGPRMGGEGPVGGDSAQGPGRGGVGWMGLPHKWICRTGRRRIIYLTTHIRTNC